MASIQAQFPWLGFGKKHAKNNMVIINGYIAHYSEINDYETSQDDNFFNQNNVSHFM